MLLSLLATGVAGNVFAAVAENLLSDAGFEAISGNEPNSGTTPWFTSGEGSDGSFTTATDQAHGGAQSARFAFYYDDGAIVQNTGVPVQAGRDYELSVWAMIAEPSTAPAHTNASLLTFSIYTSPTVDGTYSWRKSQYGNIPSATNEWQQFTRVFTATELSDWVGQYIQVRFIKQNANSTYKINIDDASFGMVDNLLLDPGFEAITGNQPDAGTTPWYTTGEANAANFVTSTTKMHGGAQSAVFKVYNDAGAIVQNLDEQVDTGKTYQISIWMMISEQSGTASYTNEPKLNIGLYTSPTLGGTYAFRQTLKSCLNTTTDTWEQFSTLVDGASWAAYAGEYIQLRFNKPNTAVSHRMYLDDAYFSTLKPKTIRIFGLGSPMP